VLKIVATTIQELCDGDIAKFLAEGTLVLGDIRELLEQQLCRLSDVERQVMYGLATHHRLMTLSEWSEDFVCGVSKRERLEAVESLLRRCLIDKATPIIEKKSTFTLQPVVRIYVAQQLSEQMAQEVTAKELALLRGGTILGSVLNDDPTSKSDSKKRNLKSA
jgi:hypothetical protein